ncbi:MAG: Trans-aconitate 2-methyltransferase [Chlamydiae bacterium]|nr:Trans-aconitate 2-methyltransferase [Chlamydiota bacterium]
MTDEIVDFDEYTDNYEELLEDQLSFFSSSRDYFSAYKVQLLKRSLDRTPKKILDFGCGIGLSLPHLLEAFQGSEIYGSDISLKSLESARQNYPKVTILDTLEESSESFDLIFLAGVIHHVPPRDRPLVMQQIQSLLTPGGEVCIFEHNPFNPITRRIVSNCPFDKGVVLVPKQELKRLMKAISIEPTKSEYCLFFPASLRALRAAERFLSWLPLGGQYFVMGKKSDE